MNLAAARPMTTPTSTYRLQLRNGIGFAEARALADYLHALGVGALYTSPYLRACAGSSHGYDIVDYGALDPALGDLADYHALTDRLRELGVGHIFDMVPHHMGIAGGENRRWEEVLEDGMASIHAEWFDIEWHPQRAGMDGRVLLPLLDRHFAQALEDGEIKAERDGGRFFITYRARRLPAALSSLRGLLAAARARLGPGPGADPAPAPSDAQIAELESIVTAIDHLPDVRSTPADAREARAREKEVIKRRLAAVFTDAPAIAAAVDEELAALAGVPGDPRSFDALEALLGAQVYRLCYWRVAAEEINYRRFFDINDMAAIRVEEPAVFADAHALVLELIAEGRVSGLRLDHTDGLFDPAAYFSALQAAIRARAPAATRSVYVIIEKILAADETVPRHWEIDGTTGYDFLAQVQGLWIAPAGERPLSAILRRVTGADPSFAATARDGRLAILRASLSSEIHMLCRALDRIAAAARRSRDFTLASLTDAIVELFAAFPVYRLHVRPDGSRSEGDDERLAQALLRARRRLPEIDASVFAFLRDLLELRRLPGDAGEREAIVRFAMRFSQTTGPVMAKGVEDTAFYRHQRLIALNEVGDDPGRFGRSVADFHAHNARQARDFPRTMTTTSTHDSKRAEDARARLAVLSEAPDRWRHALAELRRLARPHERVIDGERAPSPGDAYFFYQTIVGALPFDELGRGDAPLPAAWIDRVAAAMNKAIREARERTSWIQQDSAYEEAVDDFVRGLLGARPFAAALRRFVAAIAPAGIVTGLAQLCLKLVSPGVPDFYQGSELWALSLVDPDNRRPVDFDLRRRLLAEVSELDAVTDVATRRALVRALLASAGDGRVKLHLTRAGLHHRRAHPELYLAGAYHPLASDTHWVGVARRHQGDEVICAVPRLAYTLCGGESTWPIGQVWGDRIIDVGAPGRFVDLFTGARHQGRELALAEVFADLPVAILERER